MLTCEDSRKFFPYLESGKKYFNHAAISPLPKCAKDAIDNYLHIRSETEIEPYFETLTEAIGAKNQLAKMLNVEPGLIAWSSNVSNSLNILAQGLNWKRGDEIILNDIEFPSNVYPFLNLNKLGVEVLFAKNEKGVVDIPQIERLITPRTKLISISMVQFLTGYRADLKSLGELCKKNDIVFSVDGIQGAGVVGIDLKECNIDFFAGGSHKWLMGLQGLGYFYLSPKLLELVNPKNIGWTSVKNPWNLLDYNVDLIESAEKFQIGTLPRIAIIALNSSLEFFNRIGLNEIERQIIGNSRYLRELLIENGFNSLLLNVEEKNIAGIISFTHKNSVEIVNQLQKRNVICSVREGMIRISPHFYNSQEDFDEFMIDLKEIEKK